MLITLKGLDGAPVVINTDQVIYIAQAGDERKNPILGASAVAFVGGTALAVKGSPSEVAAIITGEPHGLTPGIRAN